MRPAAKDWIFRADLWVWARLVPVLAFRRDLPSLLALATARTGKPYVGLAPADVAERVKRAVRKPWLMRNRQCLREGVLAYRFLGKAGHAPILHFGIDRKSLNQSLLAAHCWVVVGNEVLLNAPDEDMVEMLVYGSSQAGEAPRLKQSSKKMPTEA